MRANSAVPATAEEDPLLPRNRPAPEISGYGSCRPSTSVEVTYDDVHLSPRKDDGPEDDEEKEASDLAEFSFKGPALSTFFSVFTFLVLFALIALIAFPGGLRRKRADGIPRPNPIPGGPTLRIGERAERILDKTPLIDGHNDLAAFIRDVYKNQIQSSTFRARFEHGGMEKHVDLPRLRKGKVGGAFWSAYIECPVNASYDFSNSVYGQSVSATLAQIDLIRRVQINYSKVFSPAGSSLTHALSLFHQNRSLISPISIEGLHQIPQMAPASTLRLYHSLGVRAATLTWNCHNAFADAALIPSNETGETIPAPSYRGGLTPAGRKVVREMNRIGILVDLSHTSYWTQRAVLSDSTSLAPVIFSHSSSFTICPHPRNVHDDILRLVKATNSIVMINFAPGFISCLPAPNSSVLPKLHPPNNTLHQIARHVVYVGEKIGYDHVGIGSDFDGIDTTPMGMDGVDKFPDLVAELLRMGVSDEDAGKIVGENIIRVWQAAEDVSKKMQADGVLPMEDEVSERGKEG